ncbi:transposase [Paenibacillus thiaminolyticus]|uniref:IS110 family transposase n=1 Tax=Paenibacillus thiaminolyticus TaxID=49283 RepID=UPI003D28632B
MLRSRTYRVRSIPLAYFNGVSCSVIAPSLIPARPGDHIKTDRRDALRLAQLLRAGELAPVFVPSRENEALRDLVRAREAAREDLHRARRRVVHFLLLHQIHHPPTMKTRWTKTYVQWLTKLTFERKAEQVVFQEYCHSIVECEMRLKRLEEAKLGLGEVTGMRDAVLFYRTAGSRCAGV